MDLDERLTSAGVGSFCRSFEFAVCFGFDEPMGHRQSSKNYCSIKLSFVVIFVRCYFHRLPEKNFVG